MDYRANPKTSNIKTSRTEAPDPWQEGLFEDEIAAARSKNWETVVRISHRLSFIGFVVFMAKTIFAFRLPSMAGLMGLLTLAIATPCGLICGLMSMLLENKFDNLTKFEQWSGILAFCLSALPALFLLFYLLQYGF